MKTPKEIARYIAKNSDMWNMQVDEAAVWLVRNLTRRGTKLEAIPKETGSA